MKDIEWFETWYTSPYYRIGYDLDHHVVPEEFLHRLVHILSLPPGNRLLDMGCRLGKDAYYLESLGYDVTGIDLSTSFIQEARAQESETLGFYEHDMRSAFWINYFDCVFNLFSSFGYFETHIEHVHCLRNARLSLRNGGKIVLDFINVDHYADNLIPHQEFNKGSAQFIIDTKIDHGVIRKDIKIIDGDKCFFFEEYIRAFTLEDFEDLFEESGFRLDHIYGNYDLEKFDANNSERLILLGSKL